MSATIVDMPRLPGWMRLIVLAGSAAGFLSALAVLGLAVAHNSRGAKMAYDTLGFEVVILVACVFGMLLAWGQGRYRSGPAVALACAAGAIGVGSLLGMLGSDAPYHGLPRLGVKRFNGVSLAPILDARLALAAVLAALSCATVLTRRPHDSIRSLAIGIALGIPALMVMVGLWAMRGTMAAWPPAMQGLTVIFGGLVVLGFFAASVHMIVRAFEFGDQDMLSTQQKV